MDFLNLFKRELKELREMKDTKIQIMSMQNKRYYHIIQYKLIARIIYISYSDMMKNI
jgi:hypothetical protein